MRAQWIMIAGPYRSGAPSEAQRRENLRRMNAAAVDVFRKGHVPIIGVNLALPIIEQAGESAHDAIMLPLSLAAAQRCDAVLRVGGESAGADREVEVIRANGGTVYRDVAEIPTIDGDA